VRAATHLSREVLTAIGRAVWPPDWKRFGRYGPEKKLAGALRGATKDPEQLGLNWI